jgi:Na+/melibiose symporter-like transporter
MGNLSERRGANRKAVEDMEEVGPAIGCLFAPRRSPRGPRAATDAQLGQTQEEHASTQLIRVTRVRRRFIWLSLLLAAAVLVGLFLQLYFIAAWLFGESGALDAHKNIGSFAVHPVEILAFVAALVGWWGVWRNVLWSLALPIIGTVQIFFVGDVNDPGNGYVHGLHGGLVLFVAAIAGMIVRREVDALGLRRQQELPVGAASPSGPTP